ncbi:MAG: YlbE family protein [Aggregatilineales bacterium]
MIDQRKAANQRAVQIFQQAAPAVVDIQPARDVIPGMTDNMLLHAGPPIRWEAMCGPMRGAILGALVYEGLARDLDDAEHLCDKGIFQFEPCHQHQAVAPMAGIISPSMPVWVIEDSVNRTRAFSNLNEGPGKTLRYGANAGDVIERLRWMRDVLAPCLREAVLRIGPLPIFSLVHEALQMGDECHSRNHAALPLLIQALMPGLLETTLTNRHIAEVFNFMVSRDYFFLNLTMAACKAAWLAAEAIPDCSVVTAFSRNGVEFGIRVQGQWFTAPSPAVNGHYFPGFTADQANPDIGDSAITEASGLGGFAVGGAPAIVEFIGGTAEGFMQAMLEMYELTITHSTQFQLPLLNGRGTPTGVDVFRVVETGICPFITTGIAHKHAGIGQIGGGSVRAPIQCFEKAVTFLSPETDRVSLSESRLGPLI